MAYNPLSVSITTIYYVFCTECGFSKICLFEELAKETKKEHQKTHETNALEK